MTACTGTHRGAAPRAAPASRAGYPVRREHPARAAGAAQGGRPTCYGEDRMLKPPPTGVLCCGNIVLDVMVRPVEQFHWGTTTWVDSIDQNLGGNGSTPSYTRGMWGVPVRWRGMLGGAALAVLALSFLCSG